MLTQNELDFDDHPICDEFPVVIRINGWYWVGWDDLAFKAVTTESFLRIKTGI
jgi:hypothetical protein